MKSFSAVVITMGFVLAGWPWAGGAQSARGGQAAVAKVGNVSITAAEFERRLGNRLFPLLNQEYELKVQVARELIAERLFAEEARRRKIPVAQLLQQEIEAKIQPVTEAEKKSQYEQIKSRVQGRPMADVLRDIENDMRQNRLSVRRQAFVNELSAKAGATQILLEPPRLKVSSDTAADMGPKTAPVNIVEFSDFQCPYCSRVVPVLKEIEHRYPGKVRVAFRHYPLPFHAQAAKAAEAAECARDQGKFWEMHDKLFATQADLSLPELKKRGAELGLKAAQFGQCLDSGRTAQRVQKDRTDGESYAITGTPCFFVNGRMISGAQPVERFAQVIDEELARVPGKSGKPTAGK